MENQDENLVLDEESAEAEFQRFIDAHEIDADERDMDSEDLQYFRKQKRKLTRAFRDGSLVLDADGCPEYVPQHPASRSHTPVKFRSRSGASLMAGDTKKPNHLAAKTYAMMGDMTQKEPKYFAGLAGRDIKICEAIFGFLMD